MFLMHKRRIYITFYWRLSESLKWNFIRLRVLWKSCSALLYLTVLIIVVIHNHVWTWYIAWKTLYFCLFFVVDGGESFLYFIKRHVSSKMFHKFSNTIWWYSFIFYYIPIWFNKVWSYITGNLLHYVDR